MSAGHVSNGTRMKCVRTGGLDSRLRTVHKWLENPQDELRGVPDGLGRRALGILDGRSNKPEGAVALLVPRL